MPFALPATPSSVAATGEATQSPSAAPTAAASAGAAGTSVVGPAVAVIVAVAAETLASAGGPTVGTSPVPTVDAGTGALPAVANTEVTGDEAARPGAPACSECCEVCEFNDSEDAAEQVRARGEGVEQTAATGKRSRKAKAPGGGTARSGMVRAGLP